LAKEIGGEAVTIKTATHARQDPHHIRARPSLLAAMRKADMIFCSGAGLEAGWLPLLLERGKPSTQPGQPGYLMAADHVTRLEVPISLDRSQGDIHAEGNPHVHLNPHNITIIARVLAKRLQQLDPGGAYDKNLADFTSRWQAKIREWEKKSQVLRYKKVLVHHRSWSYLLDWLQMKEVGTLEPKPGLPPSIKHLKQLVTAPSRVVLLTSYDDDGAAKWLAKERTITILRLPYTLSDKTPDLFDLFEQTLTQLVQELT